MSERAILAATLLHGRSRESKAIEEVAPFLTLDGLRILFEKSRLDRE